MVEPTTLPSSKDTESVGTRVSWGAIFAGALVALGLYFLLGIMGAAVGLTVSERVNPANLQHWAIAWTVGIISVSLFIGGLVTSQFTVGEDKIEAVLYGIIMWALLFTLLLTLGALGVRSNFHRIVNHATWSQTGSNWEQAAREAGVPADQIDIWRRKLQGADEKAATHGNETRNQTEVADATTRITWYAFGGVWASMLASAAGALFGAGPSFRSAQNNRARILSQ